MSDVHHRGRLSTAFRQAYEAAGLSQQALGERLGIDQSLISKYARGAVEPPLELLPEVDRACGQPLGHVLRLAGYVDDTAADVLAAIKADQTIREDAKVALVDFYRSFRRNFPR